MSGEWIKVELSLPQKPEVIRIGRALGIPPEAVCGWLIKFWGWVSNATVDGSVTQVALRDVDMVMGLPGFADAMVAVRWLRFDEDTQSLVVPNFERHNGESAKKRALGKNRQGRFRETSNANSNAPSVTNVTQIASPEKRREEVKEAESYDSLVWNHGLKIFTSQGMPEKEARSFIGMLLGKHEEADVQEAIEAAAGKTDAKSYVRAILKTKPYKGEKKMGLVL